MLKLLLAYSSIILGFYFAFAIVFYDKPSMMHMVYRVNKVLSMAMGEVDMGIFDEKEEEGCPKPPEDESAKNTSYNFWQYEFWEKVPLSGHLIYTTFCLTVPMLILNILTAFTIKVWVILTLSVIL